MDDFTTDDDDIFSQDFVDDDDDEVISDIQTNSSSNYHPLNKNSDGGNSRIDFKVFTIADIQLLQQQETHQVSDLCNISTANAYALLSHFKWNKERLLEDFMEDSSRVLKKSNLSLQPPIYKPASSEFSCPICCSDISDNPDLQCIQIACSHEFCSDCFTTYLKSKILSEGESRRIVCPGAGCNTLITADFIRSYLDAKTVEKYNNLLMRAFVTDSDTLKYCPAPDCNNIIKCSVLPSQLNSIVPTVTCICGKSFCFGCSLDAHEPCICSLVKLWLKKCADDSETSNWLSANTKECSKCKYTIEKNGGCNHMSCKNCKYEFCWVCLGPWTEHGTSYYNCNRFNEKSSKTARESQAKSRAALERYLHYFNRYNNHQQSAKLANDYFARTEKKMEELQLNSDFSWIEVQFMKKALEVVIECRHALKWTYAFAYYLEHNNMSVLFEDNQRDLEIAVESLNELIENPLPDKDDQGQKEKIMELKQMCLDKTEYCSKRRKIVIDDTARGLLEERWKFES